MAGKLVLVVGPSGAGKDTLIAAARVALAGDSRYSFPRRLVTRDAIAELEDHDTIGRDAFEAGVREGGFALSWQAHGLGYALPKSVEDDLTAGRTVVANVSRWVIANAVTRYPGARVILVTASRAVRAARLAGRGRETADDVALRLAREGVEVPPGAEPVVIDNSGPLATSIASFIAALA